MVDTLIDKAISYIEQVLGIQLSTPPWREVTKLPFCLRSHHAIHEIEILRTTCLLVPGMNKLDSARREAFSLFASQFSLGFYLFSPEIASFSRRYARPFSLLRTNYGH